MAENASLNLDTRDLNYDERSVWKLAKDNMFCVVMSTAIRLANEIFSNSESGFVKRIFLEFNVENSELDLLDRDLKQHIVELADDIPKENCQRFLDMRFSASDTNIKRDLIFINSELIKYCVKMTKETSGFHRVVFFMAISLLHETPYWKQCDLKNKLSDPDKELCESAEGEAGQNFEFQLNNGILSLEYKEEPVLKLKIYDLDENGDVMDSTEISSSEVRTDYYRQQQQQHQYTPTATEPRNARQNYHPQVHLRVETQGMKVKILVTNKNHEEVFLPSDISSRYLVVRLYDDSTLKLCRKRFCAKRNVYVAQGSELKTLSYNQSCEFATDLKSLICPRFDVNHDGIYTLKLKLEISFSSSIRHLTSEFSINRLFLRHKEFQEADDEDKNEDSIILGRVPLPNEISFRYNK